MDAFGDANFEQTEVDPAAEFLAREQNALAGLEDEIPLAQPAVTGNGVANGDVTQSKAGIFIIIIIITIVTSGRSNRCICFALCRLN